ncbi:ubiquinol-cytochrome C chaperone [Aquibium carbonis]|uniref:Ubiquinol-cytochrome C chaperone n=1 Tax=Aquibium carbonis TaxID=2495581 RepID=A0A429Z0X9_9HYPH|nr:ubiquinol-cytochrome C chaperone family protein [Aquibium carbonis]RST87353.1 ubiquinol-cytochrome C chaperone [Aquibium carbonis]
MLSRLFGRWRNSNQDVVDRLYERIVAAARQPVFYSQWNVPDTPLGRFEMLSLHMFLFLHRCRRDEAVLRDLAQELTDDFFTDVDHSLRELGIGDMGVPKRMKKLAKMFYGRAQAYGEAIDAGDLEALSLALSRNVLPETAEWPQSTLMAAYVLEANSALAAQTAEEISAGRVEFPARQG